MYFASKNKTCLLDHSCNAAPPLGCNAACEHLLPAFQTFMCLDPCVKGASWRRVQEVVLTQKVMEAVGNTNNKNVLKTSVSDCAHAANSNLFLQHIQESVVRKVEHKSPFKGAASTD